MRGILVALAVAAMVAWAITKDRPMWIIPATVLAAMALASPWFMRYQRSAESSIHVQRVLSVELDRARRYERSVAVVRVGSCLGPADVAAARVSLPRDAAHTMRATDVSICVGDDLYIVLPETGREGALALITRLEREIGPRPSPDDGVAVFPDDGITAPALLEKCRSSSERARSIPRDSSATGGPMRAVVKRTLDIAVSLVAMPFVLPLVAVAAIAVKLDSRGPVFFRQSRTGRDGRRFKMTKLRTMVADAEERKAELVALNDRNGPDFKVADDPRITRVGRFLRKTSLDELPQFFHVLVGQMSLVGPRPTSFAPDTYSLWHTKRLDVQPGMTGVWQVDGRRIDDFDERVRLEVSYMKNMSTWTDVKLLARTMPALLKGSGE
ncbi:MAG: sugar transferase [Acidimicrobiales bacterium]